MVLAIGLLGRESLEWGRGGGGGAEKIAWGGQRKWRWFPSVVYGIEI